VSLRQSDAQPRFEPPPLTARIEGQRLTLRAPMATDVPEARRVLRRNAEHLRPWSPLPPAGEDPSSLTEVSKAILRQRREWKRGESFIFFATPRENEDRILGRVALTGVTRQAFQNAYIGYWIDHDFQRQGLMTEAVGLATSFAFGALRLHRVQGAVMPSNLASLRVLEKLAYRREGLAERYLQIAGRWEDHVLLAVTAEEWPAATPFDRGSSISSNREARRTDG
jgi:[ribosomal protein S5]-alanine N-acetyltransferase